MENVTTRNCIYSVTSLLILSLMVIVHNMPMVINSKIQQRAFLDSENITRSKIQLIEVAISNTSKISSCVPGFNSRDQSKSGKHDNISRVFENVSLVENIEMSKNRTRNILLNRWIDDSKPLEYTFLSSSLHKDRKLKLTLNSLLKIDSKTLLLIATLLKCVHCLLTKKDQYFTKLKEENKLCPYDFLFQPNDGFQCTVKVYPYSLKKYLNNLENISDKSAKCMHNEWARLESFKTFPENCPVSTLRLAKAGFYATNSGQEAVCFCCGLKNDVWTETESVTDVHRRLSPDCRFIKGETTENISIHEDDAGTQSAACGGPEDRHLQRTRTEQSREQSNCTQVSLDQQQNKENPDTLNRTNYETISNNSHESGLNGISNLYRGQVTENFPTDEIQRFPGIINEQPKHPQYAIKALRLSSFSLWPSTKVVKPEELADAGFFFSGQQDLVRCFFCGGGMKNWEYGDSPWIEHARWFSTCAYLKQCKGTDFVNLCQVSNMTFPTQNNFQLRDLDSEPTDLVADQQIADLNSIAAKRVLDMGYIQPQVEDAIKQTRQRIGPLEELKAQNLLEYLLDNTYTPTSVQRSNNSTQSLQSSSSSSNTNDNISQRSSSPAASERQSSPKEERKLLKEQNRYLKEQMICKVCMDKDANIVFLPCGHLVTCVDCANALRKCAVCRAIIQGTVRTYPA